MLNPWIISVFAVYFVGTIGFAFHRARRLRTMSDYVLGGRGGSSLTTGLSAAASMASGWTLLVLPAIAFQHGLVTIWIVVAIIAFLWLAWIVIAQRLRRFTVAFDDALTTPDFMEKRFRDRTGIVRTVAAVITIFFIVIYVSSALAAGAKLIETTFGLQREVGVVMALIAVASYTLIGGFLAVSRTDVLQSLFVMSGFIVMTLMLFFLADGDYARNGSEYPGFWNPLAAEGSHSSTLLFAVSAIGWGLGVFGCQRVTQRFMAIGSETKIAASRNIAVSWVTVTYMLSVAVGLIALPALVATGTLDQAMADPERLYLILTNTLFHPAVVGLLLIAVVAAIMSTADSQLLFASAIAADSLPLLRRITENVNPRGRVWIGRLLLTIIGTTAAVFSIYRAESVLDLVAFAWGGMGAVFGPVTILSLYWRRFNAWGALAAMISGTLITSSWWLLSGGPYQMFDMHLAVPGFVLAFAVAIGVTLVTSKPSEEVTSLFDRVVASPTTVEDRSIRKSTKPVVVTS